MTPCLVADGTFVIRHQEHIYKIKVCVLILPDCHNYLLYNALTRWVCKGLEDVT